MNEKNNVERRYFVKIRFHKDLKYSTLAETMYFQNDMTLDFYMRWQWYFKYREALLRVQNPHSFIELSNGGYEYILPEEQHKKKVYNLLLAAKRKLTQYKRAIEYAKENWDQLFPMEEHPQYIRVMDKLKYYEDRVIILSNEYESIK